MSFKISKSLIIESIIFIIFVVFLISIPFFFNNDSNFNDEKVTNFGENSNEILKYKFQIMSEDIGFFFENNTVSKTDNNYLNKLIVSNKISNKDNSLAQELISLYEKNYINESKKLSNSLIKDFLLYYDGVETGIWRNYLFEFKSDNNSFVIYNKSDVLVNLDNATIKGNYSFLVEPYQFQIYNISLENGSSDIVKINLFKNFSDEKLSKYINLETHKPLIKIKDIKSYYIKSNKKYIFNFYIWK